jgi:MFS family permease
MPQLVAGMILARIAAQMVGLILVLFVLDRYASPALAGITTFLSLFPGLLVSPIAGTLLDRYGRRSLIIADYLVAGVAFTIVALLSLAGALPVPLFLALVTVASLTFPLSTTGMRTLFPLIVPRPLWERANAIDSNGYAFAGIIAPAAAGALVGAIRGEGALLVTSALFVLASGVTALFREPPIPTTAHGPVLKAAWAGVVHVARHRTLRSLALGVSVSNIANGTFFIALPVLVIQRLGGSSELVGQLFAGMGLAAFVSVFLFGRLGTEGRERELMAGSMLGITAAIALLLLRVDLPTIAVSALAVGIATGPFDIALFTLRQRRTDPAWLGRAFAVSMALNFIGFPIGSALGGALATISPELALLTAVGFSALAAILTLLFVPRS